MTRRLVPPVDRRSGRHLFGRDASGYDRSRPDYPDRVYEVLADRCGLGPGTRLFEVGAGTGQATLPLAAAGARVTAVEPDPQLAASLVEKVEGEGLEIAIQTTPFEDVSLPAGQFDLGAAATAFHWVEPSVGLVKALRLLRAGGWWAMWWNVFMDETRPDPFYEATTPILQPLGRGPSAGSGGPPFALDLERRRSELQQAGFVATEVEVIRWTARLSTERLRALYSTFSSISQLPDDERERVLDAIAAIADKSFGGTVDRPFQTVLYTSRKV